MAIAPVSSVSFRNNYNHVNFEGKKEKKSSGMHVPSAIKAIPLATMLAMSPLNSIEMNAQTDKPCPEVCTGVYSIENGAITVLGPRELLVEFYSNDCDDSSVERVNVFSTRPNKKTSENVNGVYKDCIKITGVNVEVQKAEKTKKFNEATGKFYYVYSFKGPGYQNIAFKLADDDTKVVKRKKVYSKNNEICVKEDVFNAIVKVLGDKIDVTEIDDTKKKDYNFDNYRIEY